MGVNVGPQHCRNGTKREARDFAKNTVPYTYLGTGIARLGVVAEFVAARVAWSVTRVAEVAARTALAAISTTV
jgi:hypothetical protein